MDRRSKIILGLFMAVIITIIVMEIARPKPVKWSSSYTSFDKIPFGCYVLHREIETLFPENAIQTIYESPYLHLEAIDTISASSYLFINSYINFDQQEINQLIRYAERGNSVFIAAGNMSPILKDTLKLTINTSSLFLKESLKAKEVNPGFTHREFTYTKGVTNSHITAFDTLNTTILGYTMTDKKQDLVNFVKIKSGKGAFFINTLPQAFSNYYMLKGNKDYVANALSYLPGQNVYWDDYKKDGKVVITSPMRYVLSETSLQWAYYLLIFFLLLFIIFKAKRQQRIIPVIVPLENSSVDFTRTISRLYYQHKNYGDIILKRIRFFLANVRSYYHLNTEDLSAGFIEKLALKSGVATVKTTELVDTIKEMMQKKHHTEKDLIALDKLLDYFKF